MYLWTNSNIDKDCNIWQKKENNLIIISSLICTKLCPNMSRNKYFELLTTTRRTDNNRAHKLRRNLTPSATQSHPNNTKKNSSLFILKLSTKNPQRRHLLFANQMALDRVWGGYFYQQLIVGRVCNNALGDRDFFLSFRDTLGNWSQLCTVALDTLLCSLH